MSRREPIVRIRSTPDDDARAVAALARAGFAAERSLTWLVVRDADPDAVNEALVVGGATVRVAIREGIGRLVGWLLDREGRLDGRLQNVKTLARRVLEDGGRSPLVPPVALPLSPVHPERRRAKRAGVEGRPDEGLSRQRVASRSTFSASQVAVLRMRSRSPR
ncbi:MAG TPA: hypothetical protein VD838_16190 [Anaeromyxobacteraceae bacterium]|nr:hypothetical protein [Anaeromyxobacteraceae bacterium]